MTKVSSYKIAQGVNGAALETAVAALIALGYEPEEGVFATPGSGLLNQKLVKREEAGTDIVAFNRLAGQVGATVIDDEAKTVELDVTNGTVLGSEAFQMTLSPGAASNLATPQAFVDGVAKAFNITSESGDVAAWTVTITVL
ncbi:MAG: hypothetical protein RIE86_09165 [Imperialibacter sp.]|uniref:hypothetical protein n=1 Tax=Imperialibacter sp. TaxID=2038411 RepID=UPI0032EDE1B6